MSPFEVCWNMSTTQRVTLLPTTGDHRSLRTFLPVSRRLRHLMDKSPRVIVEDAALPESTGCTSEDACVRARLPASKRSVFVERAVRFLLRWSIFIVTHAGLFSVAFLLEP
jgi:hypothetical protein